MVQRAKWADCSKYSSSAERGWQAQGLRLLKTKTKTSLNFHLAPVGKRREGGRGGRKQASKGPAQTGEEKSVRTRTETEKQEMGQVGREGRRSWDAQLRAAS